jgi:hypothetical protein
MRRKKIEVNIAEGILRYFESDRVVLEYDCVTGRAKHPTPVGSYVVESKELCWQSRSRNIKPLTPGQKVLQELGWNVTGALNFGTIQAGPFDLGVVNLLDTYSRSLTCNADSRDFKKGHEITKDDILTPGFMPFALFFDLNERIAIHATPSYFTKKLLLGDKMLQKNGNRDSGSLGCVRLFWEDARTLYGLVDPKTTSVVIKAR